MAPCLLNSMGSMIFREVALRLVCFSGLYLSALWAYRIAKVSIRGVSKCCSFDRGRCVAAFTTENAVFVKYRFTRKGIGHFTTAGVLTMWWGVASNWRFRRPLPARIVDTDGDVLDELDGLSAIQ